MRIGWRWAMLLSAAQARAANMSPMGFRVFIFGSWLNSLVGRLFCLLRRSLKLISITSEGCPRSSSTDIPMNASFSSSRRDECSFAIDWQLQRGEIRRVNDRDALRRREVFRGRYLREKTAIHFNFYSKIYFASGILDKSSKKTWWIFQPGFLLTI